MNTEQVLKVKKVLAMSVLALAELKRQTNDDRKAIAGLPMVCEKLWDSEFPQGTGGKSRKVLDLSGADLHGGLFANLSHKGILNGANFSGANLEGSHWVFCAVQNADFSNANLRNAVTLLLFCSGASFQGADLSGSDLNLFIGTEKQEPINFTNANLTGAKWQLLSAAKYDFTGAQMQGLKVSVLGSATSAKDKADREKTLQAFLDCLSPEQRAQITIQSEKSGCFIATACFGFYDAPEVRILRRFRDEVMAGSQTGRRLIKIYYRVSPPLARILDQSPWMRWMIRTLCLRPLVWWIARTRFSSRVDPMAV
jgi:hypothetical protein